MSEKETIDKIIDLLSQIRREQKNRKKFINLLEDFLDSISRNDKFWDSQAGQLLADFNY